MNPTGKKFISLFLVFSLIMLSVNLYAKERRGAKLIITKKDGQLIEGELITVKTDSLLLLNTERKDVSVDVEEIKVIRVVKKSKVLLGAGAGLLWGALFGASAAALFALLIRAAVGGDGEVPWWFILRGGAAVASIGAIAGGIGGAIAGIDKEIQIEGMTDSEIREALDKLRKKARIRDYK